MIAVETAWRLAVTLLAAAATVGEWPLRRPFLLNWFAFLWRPALIRPAAIIAAFWILAGAALRAAVLNRGFLRLLGMRMISFVAGAAAALLSLQMVVTIARGAWPLHLSMGIVSLFSLAVYGCWRWVSLLLLMVEETGGWRAGWQSFVHTGPHLALAAATNSTIKWFFLTLAAMPAMALWRNAVWTGLGITAVASIAISGYFAARLREAIHDLL